MHPALAGKGDTMSAITTKKIDGYTINAELFNSADECVRLCKTRPMTSDRFHDMQEGSRIRSEPRWFGGIHSYDEALSLLHTGYQPTVESMRGLFRATVSGEGKRFYAEILVRLCLVMAAELGLIPVLHSLFPWLYRKNRGGNAPRQMVS